MSCSPKPVNVALLGTGVRSSKGLEMRLSRITWVGPTPRAPASLRETGRGGTQRGDGPCDPAEAGVMCPQAQGRRGPPEAGTVRKDHALEPPVGAQPVDTLVLDLRFPERGEWMSVVQAAQGEVICSEKWTRPPRWQDGLAVPAKGGRRVSWPSSGHGPRTLVPARPGSVTVLGPGRRVRARSRQNGRRPPHPATRLGGLGGPMSPLPHSTGGACGGGVGRLCVASASHAGAVRAPESITPCGDPG